MKGIVKGSIIRATQGNTRSLDCSSYEPAVYHHAHRPFGWVVLIEENSSVVGGKQGSPTEHAPYRV